MTEQKISKTLQDLANQLVKQAIEEGLSASELENLIRETRSNAGLKRRIPLMESLYRTPTETELEFKEKCYEFFKKEITIEDLTSSELKARGKLISEKRYEQSLINFSILLFAAKMLINDGEKITNQKIRDVLWSSGEYKNYTVLLSDISYTSSQMREVVYPKYKNNSWPEFIRAYHSCHTSRIVKGYFAFLEKQGIS